MSSRPRILVLNQYYWPGVEATANLLTELCEALAGEYEVTVVTGSLPGSRRERTLRNGVEIVRVPSTAYDRSRLSRRTSNYITYVFWAVRAAVRMERPSVVVCMTDPPFLGTAAEMVARRFGVPLLLISQDVFPEIAVKLGRLRNRAVVGLLRVLVARALKRADRVVVIGETMQRRVQAKGVEPRRMRVIPNWGDAGRIGPQPRENEWALEHGLTGVFVVMHSGNVGHAQDLDTLIRATTLLRDLDDLVAMIIGAGARYDELVGLAQRLEADAVRFLPYQPRELLPQSLASADVHVVGLARGLAGYVVPSRLYGILAAGRPVIAAAEAESETAQLVLRSGCGVVVPPADPLALAGAIRACHDGEFDLAEMGRRAREYAENETDRRIAVDRYRNLIEEVRLGAGG